MFIAIVTKLISLILLVKTDSSLGFGCESRGFDCGNGKCISELWLCDGANDCGNMKDEHNCENNLSPNLCFDSHFTCESDRHCIPKTWLCDGEKDCEDGSDEKRCDSIKDNCDGFHCRNHHCIPSSWRCDKKSDCTDGSDEENCPTSKLCLDHEYACSSGSCLNKSLVCDGKKDCVDGSDEGQHCGDACKNKSCSQKCEATPSGPKCFCVDGYVLDKKDNATCIDVNECLQEGFCSQKCVNTIGSFQCSCQEDYELVGRSCKAKGSEPLLLMSTNRDIRGLRLRSGQYFSIRKTVHKTLAMDVDPNTQNIYWIEISNRSSIYSSKLDGSSFKTVISHGLLIPEDIAVDYITNHLYLTDSGLKQVLACKIEGTMCHVLHSDNVEKPLSLVLDLLQGFVYWSDCGESTVGIYRSGMDGSRLVSLVSKRIAWPNSITIDHTTNRLYWADTKLNRIEYISLNGNSRKIILNAAVFRPYSLTVFEDIIYWTDKSAFSLESCNKFTGRNVSLVTRDNGNVRRVHVYHPVLTAKGYVRRQKSLWFDVMQQKWNELDIDTSDWFNLRDVSTSLVPPLSCCHNGKTPCKLLNPCWSNDCSHMCLISPKDGFRCACPLGFRLLSDDKTCSMEENTAALFFSEGSRLFYIRPEVVGSQTVTKLPLSLNSAVITGVAYDQISKSLFIADGTTPVIHSVNMTSLSMRELVRNYLISPEDVSFDHISGNVYWIDSSKGTAEVISIDRMTRLTLLTDLMNPVALEISPTKGLMFIVEVGIKATVSMYDMNGKNKKTLNSLHGFPISLALHPSQNVLYWADPSAGTISYVNLDSSSFRVLQNKVDGVISVAVSEKYIYWTARKSEINLLKENATYVLQLPGEEQEIVRRKVAYFPPIKAKEKQECRTAFGNCSHFCLTTPKGKTCACPDGLLLADDNITCVERRCEVVDFRCMSDLRCIPTHMRCDGKRDCIDGSDEIGCGNRCSGDDFQCKNGRCILKSWRCDHRNDCLDNSDEENCPKAGTCTSEQVTCNNGECISLLWRCDGESDCDDGSDELNCNETRCDPESHLRCNYGQCVPISWVCDGTDDCYDGSDERNCSAKQKICSSDEFQCESDKTCVGGKLKCDGLKDCADGSDERNCSLCQPGEFFCIPMKLCLAPHVICNGAIDCKDGSDEKDCAETGRKNPYEPPKTTASECDEFFCYASSQCLPWSKVCDGRLDCEDLPDEGGLCSRSCIDNGGCSQKCTKSPKGSQCSCLKGYRILQDNKTCDDIDECLEPGTCSQFCNNTKGGFKCSCAEGYFLDRDHRLCKAEGSPATLVYLLSDEIIGLELDNHKQRVYINIPNADMRGMDYDVSEAIFYWTEWNDGSINSYSQDTHRQDIIVRTSSKPYYVRYDWIAKNLYYTDEKSRIGVCTKDGRFCRILIPYSNNTVDSIDISPTTGHMFWTSWMSHLNNENGLITRAEMDSSNRRIIVSKGTMKPSSITVDHIVHMIYWTDAKLNTLECSDFDGARRRHVVRYDMYYPFAMTIFENYVYWADWHDDTILKCEKFTGKECFIIKRKHVKAVVLLTYHKVMQQKGSNRCENRCPHLCLLTRNSYTCLCGDSYSEKDGLCHDIPVSTSSPSKCPEYHCPWDSECVVKDGKYVCNCPEQYTGEKCERIVDSKRPYDYSWIVFLIMIITAIAIVVLIVLLCCNRKSPPRKYFVKYFGKDKRLRNIHERTNSLHKRMRSLF